MTYNGFGDYVACMRKYPRQEHRKLGATMTGAIRPFRIDVGDEVLADLKSRLQRTRWPDAELVTDWSQGVPLKWIQDICQCWANTYDWRARGPAQSL